MDGAALRTDNPATLSTRIWPGPASEDRGDPVTHYARLVAKRKIPAAKWQRLACKRHLADLRKGHKRGLSWDLDKAWHAIDFFPAFLRHYKGEWGLERERFHLWLWQMFVVGSIFGWRRRDGTRRFRVVYIELPRKNGKTALAAGLAAYLTFCDLEPAAEVYCAATKRDQAKICHEDVKQFIRSSPLLNKRAQIRLHTIAVPSTLSVCTALGADADSLDGLNPHGMVVDELHKHKTRAVVDVLETGTGARRQPLQIEITTAGEGPEGVCWEHRDHSEKVLEGILDDDAWFGFICTLDEDDDWTDPKVWAKANPNLGISVKVEALAEQVQRAQAQPTAAAACKRTRFCIWTGAGSQWLDMSRWQRGQAEFDPAELAGRPCFGGLDLSTKIDLTAWVLVFPPEDINHGIWHVLPRFYMPADNVATRVQEDKVPYDVWIDDGWITATPGDTVDYDQIFDDVVADGEDFLIQEIGFDSWNAAHLANRLIAEGFDMVEMRQGTKTMSGPSKDMEALVKSRRFNTGGNPVMRWNARNVRVRADSNDNYMPDKSKSTGRIDGIVASIMGVGRAMVQVEQGTPSVGFA